MSGSSSTTTALGHDNGTVNPAVKTLNLVEEAAATVDIFDLDALAPFTDTLFYDWDLERYLDGVGYEALVDESSGSREDAVSTPTTTTRSYLDEPTPKFDEEAAAEEVGGGSSSSGGGGDLTDFLNFKFQQPPTSSTATAKMSTSSSSSPTHEQYHFPSSTTPPAQYSQLSESDARILSIQEAARLAAEEDKRRRNTAASARFRIKKKQRDQAIERQAKEMADKVQDLEKKISQLEIENRWLRNLLVEKNMAGLEKREGRYS